MSEAHGTAPASCAAAAPSPGGGPPRSTRLLALIPGLVLVALLTWGAIALGKAPWLQSRIHLSALLLVILIGMAWRSFLPVPASTAPGIRFAQRPLLRWGVAALGFRLSLSELISIGGWSLLVVTLSTFVALTIGWWTAERLRIGHKLGLLLGVGGAVCGASAIVAADTVVQSDKRDVPIALGTITLLGTIGIFLYPVAFGPLGMSEFVYGVWAGASLHETAQVVAAGFGVSDEAARIATVVKLARIALLAPVVLYLGWMMRRHHEHTGHARVSPVPWFLVLFVVFALVNSSGWLPSEWIAFIRRASVWLLCAGMAAVGLQTGLRELRAAGLRPIAAGTVQWIALATVSYGLAEWLITPRLP